MKRILVTGAAGFVGHHVVEHLLKNTDWEIVVLDKLTYAASGFDRLRDIKVFDETRVKVFTADFTKPIVDGLASEIGDLNYILHMGAESHVDNSISDPLLFANSNVMGTLELLEFARRLKDAGKGVEKFIFFSTDEVYGPAPEGVNYKEGSRHNPGNPYAASKAAAEDFCVAYANTYKLPVIITNTMNVYGARQSPEKFIPGSIRKILRGEKIMIHATPDLQKAGTRYYIHARNVAAAVLFVLQSSTEYLDIHDAALGKFNVVGEQEIDNLSLVKMLYSILKEQNPSIPDLNYEMTNFHEQRPGHDLRYALDGRKLKSVGFEFPKTFEESFKENVLWCVAEENKKWLSL